MKSDDISGILDGTEIPFAYKMSYVLNFWREPAYRHIEIQYGLKRPEIIVLIFLAYRDGITAQSICNFSGHLKANISRAVVALDKKGFIERRTEPSDNRRQLIYLTEDGRKEYQRFIPLLAGREKQMMTALSPAESKRLMQILGKLASHVPSWTGDNDALNSPEEASDRN